MIWAVLVLLGVPLWLLAIGILMLALQNRKLRKRPGNMPVRIRLPGKRRWTRGHAIWVSDVFAWRGSPAAWNEDLLQVIRVTPRAPSVDERKRLHRLGEDPVVTTLGLAEGRSIDVAVASDHSSSLQGPFLPALKPA